MKGLEKISYLNSVNISPNIKKLKCWLAEMAPKFQNYKKSINKIKMASCKDLIGY